AWGHAAALAQHHGAVGSGKIVLDHAALVVSEVLGGGAQARDRRDRSERVGGDATDVGMMKFELDAAIAALERLQTLELKRRELVGHTVNDVPRRAGDVS